MDKKCYLCDGPFEQICIVCEQGICQKDIASDLSPGDFVICHKCDKITPDRLQAIAHFCLRAELKTRRQQEASKEE